MSDYLLLMKIIIKESSLVHLIVTFLDTMDHPKGVCYVGTKLNNKGDVVLIVNLKKESYNVFGGGMTTEKLRKYYTNKVSDYMGVTPSVFFEIGKC